MAATISFLVDWDLVQQRYDAGATASECAREFGFSKQAWYKAIRRGRLALTSAEEALRLARGPGNPVYDWAAVQAYYDAGHSVRECAAHFGFCLAAWTSAVRRGVVRARPPGWALDHVIAHAKSRSHVKRRLLEAGLITNRCDFCGLVEWQGKPLAIQLDHINGNGKDNRLENLRMLCPNCHSQTETWGIRNRGTQSRLAKR